MPGVFLWGWDETNSKWIPVELSTTGELKVEMSGTYSPDVVIINDGAGHYLQLPKLTTAERDALTAVNGMVIYNSTTTQIESYENGAWKAAATITHAATHTDGTDDIQNATAAQKGVATAAQITKLDGVEALADKTDATNVAAAGAVMDADFTAADEVMVGTGSGTHGQVTLAASQLLGKKAAGAATNLTATEARAILNVADGADVTGSNAPQAHKTLHTDGTDDIQNATAAQKGVATAAQITKLDGIASSATKYPDTGEQAFLDADHSKLDGIAAGAIANVVEDTTPQLGGPLDMNEKSIDYTETLDTDGKYCGLTCQGVLGETVIYGELLYLKTADQRWWKALADSELTSGDVMLAIALEGGAAAASKLLLLQGFLREDDFDFTSYGQALFIDASTGGDMTQTAPAVATNIVRVVGYAHDDADTIFFNPDKTWLEIA